MFLLLGGFVIVFWSYRATGKSNKFLAIEKNKSEELLLNILPEEVAEELKEKGSANAMRFDEICEQYNIEKIKTIGGAYLAVCGLPTTNVNYAEQTVKAALEIRDFMKARYEKVGNNTFEVRTGVHSGGVVAGIVGVKKFAYDIWGDTVNTASRIEQNSQPGMVNVS